MVFAATGQAAFCWAKGGATPRGLLGSCQGWGEGVGSGEQANCELRVAGPVLRPLGDHRRTYSAHRLLTVRPSLGGGVPTPSAFCFPDTGR